MAHELTSKCTCPPRTLARVRNITGHAPDCPCYAEWYQRYAPRDAPAHIPAPDQVGPPTGPPDDTPAHWRGADWAIQHDTAITLASIKAEAQTGRTEDDDDPGR